MVTTAAAGTVPHERHKTAGEDPPKRNSSIGGAKKTARRASRIRPDWEEDAASATGPEGLSGGAEKA
jgi:hypothetical protein